MPLEKINLTLSKEFKILKDGIIEEPLKIFANKINEIIDVLNEKKEVDFDAKIGNINWKEWCSKCKNEKICAGKLVCSDCLNQWEKEEYGSSSICKKCVYQRVVICDECSNELMAGEDIEVGAAVFKSKTDGKIYMVKEDWKNPNFESITAKKMAHLMEIGGGEAVKINFSADWEKEFDKRYEWAKCDMGSGNFEDIKQFIRNLLK